MDDLMDMIISDESPNSISDKIKELIQAKSIEKIDSLRPYVANSLFNSETLDDQEDIEDEK